MKRTATVLMVLILFTGTLLGQNGWQYMPSHTEIKDFGTKLSEKIGYNVLDEATASRVVLLSRLEKAIKLA